MGLLPRFPSHYKRGRFIIILVIMYICFCFEPSSGAYNFNVFANDFRTEGMLGWFAQSFQMYSFVGLLCYMACIEAQNKLAKAIFYAAMWDSIFNIVNLVLLSYSYDFYVVCLRNISTAIALLYAYFVLFKEDDSWAKRKKIS